MRLPALTEVGKSRDYQIEFKGYNHNLYVGEGQFFDTQNLCATNYPVMSPRALRAKVRKLTKPQGIFSRNKLCWVDDGQFYFGGEPYGPKMADGEKQFVGMGAYVLIFPDGMRFNTSTREMDALGAEYSAAGEVKITLARLDGTDYGNVTVSEAAPESPENGAYWMDVSGAPVLKIYSGEAWIAVATTYLRIEAAGIGKAFRLGDVITIEGAQEESINGAHAIEAQTDDSITIIGIIRETVTQTGGLKAERKVPKMDYVCELNNRVWGCSSEKHEIYACKLGDATNWTAYSGLASDSYSATIGSAGDFTGCCSFGGQVLFFKEDMLHKVMGTKPSNFQISDTPLRGVQKGSEKSICIVNESLMYKSRESVVVYDGGSPMDVSDALGTGIYTDAAAGSLGDRYYISMRDEDGEWHLFVFDEAKGLWFREDATHAAQFAQLNGQLYFLDAAGVLTAVRGLQEPGAQAEETVEWYAETGDMLVNMPDNKYVSRIQIRAGVDKGATIRVELQYDSDGVWHRIFERGYTSKASFTMPIIPMRCDHMRMRISGRGRSCIYAVSKEIEKGSEL
jgi:hypothetical protein